MTDTPPHSSADGLQLLARTMTVKEAHDKQKYTSWFTKEMVLACLRAHRICKGSSAMTREELIELMDAKLSLHQILDYVRMWTKDTSTLNGRRNIRRKQLASLLRDVGDHIEDVKLTDTETDNEDADEVVPVKPAKRQKPSDEDGDMDEPVKQAKRGRPKLVTSPISIRIPATPKHDLSVGDQVYWIGDGGSYMFGVVSKLGKSTTVYLQGTKVGELVHVFGNLYEHQPDWTNLTSEQEQAVDVLRRYYPNKKLVIHL